MICPQCKSNQLKVLDGRQKGDLFWRKRRCLDCGYSFNTYEGYVPDELLPKSCQKKKKGMPEAVKRQREKYYAEKEAVLRKYGLMQKSE